MTTSARTSMLLACSACVACYVSNPGLSGGGFETTNTEQTESSTTVGDGDADGTSDSGRTSGSGGEEGGESTASDTMESGGSESGSSESGGEAVDATFSFVVIPDTQDEVLNEQNTVAHFNNRIAWIVENQAALDIRFALQTGDLVNWDTPTHDQYVRASDGLKALDEAHIPYVIAVGNHDTAAVCEGGSSCSGDTNALLRDTTTFNTFFPTSRFPTISGVFEAGKCDNSYHLIEAGGLDWVIINLELWARTDAYTWMGEVLADHPDHNAIIITHSHLDSESGIVTGNGGYGDNSPQEIFDVVLSQHANVRMVFSGHTGLSGYREDVGVHGNTIYQFLYNKLGSTNPVRVVEVDTEANTLDTYVYGPATDEMLTTPGTTVNITDVDWVR